MQKNQITIGLFDPGMTNLHRVGLAGLYMTLRVLDPAQYVQWGGWNLTPHSVELYWHTTPRDLIAPIIHDAFGIDKDGVIMFAANKGRSTDEVKFLLHEAILNSYLQFGPHCKKGETKERSSSLEEVMLIRKFKPAISYKHQSADSELFDKHGNFKQEVSIIGWVFPGGVIRHNAYSDTGFINLPSHFLALLFAPVASLYFKIFCRTQEGKFDTRKGAALVLPHITDLQAYSHDYQNFLTSPVQNFYASSLGDAGMATLVTLELKKTGSKRKSKSGMLAQLGIDSCTVITMGTVGWSKQQKTRTGVLHIRKLDAKRLNFFDTAWDKLQNKIHFKEELQEYYVLTSQVRGLIAENIAVGRDWFLGFSQLMQSKKLANWVCSERKELFAMINDKNTDWPHEADKLLVEAVHKALRNRYGALAERAQKTGTSPDFGREFERIRTSLMRCKNVQTLRAELADIFARGGLNKALQESWPKLLALFTGSDWQRARDLALLALASYQGQGVETAPTTEKPQIIQMVTDEETE